MPVDTGEFSTLRGMASAEVNKWFNGSVVEYTGFYSVGPCAGRCRIDLVSSNTTRRPEMTRHRLIRPMFDAKFIGSPRGSEIGFNDFVHYCPVKEHDDKGFPQQI